MKPIEELLEEAGRRMTKRDDGLVPIELWKEQMHLASPMFEGNPGFREAMLSHENLLRIAVCINERAIDAWIDGLIEIQRNN